MKHVANNLNYGKLFYILLAISLLIGFYLNEDSAGGGEVDLLKHEWGNIQLFTNNNIFFILRHLIPLLN